MDIPVSNSQTDDNWKVMRLEKTDEGLGFYLSHVRPFRLRMLQINPEGTLYLTLDRTFHVPRG